MTASEFRERIENEGKIKAVRLFESSCESDQQADAYIFAYICRLLNVGSLGGAAAVIWPKSLFDPRPLEVRRIWAAISQHAKTLLQGGGSLGKTYSSAVWHLLDYWRDPEYTNIKLISTTAGHAKSNLFSTLVTLHREAIVKMPGEITSDYIGLDTKERKSGMAIVAIPEGEDGKGKLQGFHPEPRTETHPLFGGSSRVRAFMDEAEKVPSGVWKGVDNFMMPQSGVDRVKITGAYNPEDSSTKTAQNAEPIGGWEMFDLDTGVQGKDEWESKEGWFVCRLDGAKSENVRQRKEIYGGFMTFDGYKELEEKGGGNSAEWFTMGRGAYPPEGSLNIIIKSAYLQSGRGNFVFLGKTTNALGADIAVDGRDDCIGTVGRFGRASGFQQLVYNQTRKAHEFILHPFPEHRMCCQADSQFELPKGSTRIVGNGIRDAAISLQVAPEWVCADRTGNGATIHDYLLEIWSAEVQGVDFSKAATNVKILEQDKFVPEELYDGIVSEVWFALARWFEFGYFCLGPNVRQDPLEQELRGRRYLLGAGKKLKVEKKDDFKVRLGRSPDHADSCTLFLHGVRMRAKLMGSMTGVEKRFDESKMLPKSRADQVKWVRFT